MTEAATTILKRPDPFARGLAEESYLSLRVGEDFVSLTDSTLRKGNNQHSGKSYSRFHLNSCLILKKKHYKDGAPRYHAYFKTGKIRNRAANFQDVTPRIAEGHVYGMNNNVENRAIAISQFFKVIGHDALPMGSEFLKLAYPMLSHNPAWQWAPGMGSALRRTDTRSFVETAFGKTRYRKDLVKAIAESPSLDRVAQARVWRGLVPIDWIVDGLQQAVPGSLNNQASAVVQQDVQLRRLLKMVDQGSRKRLLIQAMTNDRGSHFMGDTLRSVETILSAGDPLEYIGRVDGWRSLHDALATQARLAVNANRPIPQDGEIYKLLDGLVTTSGIRIESAKDTDDLIYWGGQMSNCIGSYAQQAVCASTYLFALYENDTLVGNMEVAPNGTVRQIVGKFNGNFAQSKEVNEAILAAIEEKGSKRLKDSSLKHESYSYDFADF